MRSEDEDEEDDFDEENEEDEDDGMDGGTQMNGDAEDDEGGAGDANGVEPSSDAESDEEDGEDDGEGDDDEDEDGDDDDDEDDEEDNDDDDEEDDSEGDDEDVEMAAEVEVDAASNHSQTSQSSKPKPPTHLPTPPHLLRRSLFIPSYSSTSPPSNFSIEAIIGIPHPTAVHSIASTSCSSYLLTGSQDGYVRCYDLWGSLNGGQILTVAQRAAVGQGEGIHKGGVARGWWSNDVEVLSGGSAVKTQEPVYSMACEGDGLWAVTGTQSGQINMYTVRHSPGTQVSTLKGHTQVVSCLSLLPGERGLLSGSWDGTVREWDLNTGQTVRKYATHGAQVSSVALRPYNAPSPAEASTNGDTETNGHSISVSMNPDFFEKKPPVDEATGEVKVNDDAATVTIPPPAPVAQTTEVDMTETKSQDSYDPLFDEDADGEEVPPSGEGSSIPTPTTTSNPLQHRAPTSLALPGMSKQPSATSTTATTPLFVPPTNGSTNRQGLASNIPLLSPTRYQAFSDDVLLTSTMDGQVTLMDRRVPSHEGGRGVGRLMPGDKAPPWCMSACWSSDGSQVLAGRRNGTIDIWDVRKASSTSPNLLRTLKTPNESGPVSCIVAFPDGRHIATASQDNVRLWNTADYFDPEDMAKRSKSKPPFKIIAGHHGGTISSMMVDPTSRFLITASGNRGWQGESTKVVLVHEIKW